MGKWRLRSVVGRVSCYCLYKKWIAREGEAGAASVQFSLGGKNQKEWRRGLEFDINPCWLPSFSSIVEPLRNSKIERVTKDEIFS